MLELCVIAFIIMFSHWFADFYCQTHEMAVNKSTSNYWLFKHICSYTWNFYLSIVVFALIFMVCAYFWPIMMVTTFPILSEISFILVLKFVAINAMCHWVTDYFTSRWTTKLWKENRMHDFFVVIGLDQLIHYTTYIITAFMIFA